MFAPVNALGATSEMCVRSRVSGSWGSDPHRVGRRVRCSRLARGRVHGRPGAQRWIGPRGAELGLNPLQLAKVDVKRACAGLLWGPASEEGCAWSLCLRF